MTPLQTLLLLGAALLSVPASAADEMSAVAAQVSAQVLEHSDWVAAASACPADRMPTTNTFDSHQDNDCKRAEQLPACLARCTSGDGMSCYWLANTLELAGGERPAFEPLYQHSCELGVISGCTNNAAGQLMAQPDDATLKACTARTFARACELDDPWGCTMYGDQLRRGDGVQKSNELALKALGKSCKNGPVDEACSTARDMIEEIGAEK